MNFKTELISFRVAPRSRRDLTHSLWPHREAYISAVNEAWKGKVQREKLHIHHHRDRSQHLHQEVTADSRDVHTLLPKLVLCDHPMANLMNKRIRKRNKLHPSRRQRLWWRHSEPSQDLNTFPSSLQAPPWNSNTRQAVRRSVDMLCTLVLG
jgi:hypothetical protein